MNAHRFADLFPAMSAAEFEALKADIQQHGQREPITTWRGLVVDGRHRERACRELGRPVDAREFEGDEDELLALVVSLNLQRRHLSESQRAMVAARVANLGEGRPAKTTEISVVSQSDAASLFNVSVDSIQFARKVQQQGVPALVGAVDAGSVSVSAASDVVMLPRDSQVELVAQGTRAILEASKQIRAERADQRRAERMAKIAAMAEPSPELPAGRRYAVLYVDPPWRFESAESDLRRIENHYPTMAHEDICALPVAEVATDDAVLFMWAPSAKIEEAIQIMRTWGFALRTSAVWVKPSIGQGYYFRQQHECLLLGTRGDMPTPAPADRPSSVIVSDRTEHSEKPAAVRELIERMYPGLPRLELFARTAAPGWAAWGNEVAAVSTLAQTLFVAMYPGADTSGGMF